MSVQLAELTTRFNMSELKRASAKRCLFGRPDPDKQTEYFHKQEQIFLFEEDARRFRDNWSFDPVTGPIEGGKFEYEIIHVKSSVPSFYTRDYACRKPRPVGRPGRDRALHEPSRPTKRRLDLENDENQVSDKRLPSKADLLTDAEMPHLSAALPGCRDSDLLDSPAGLLHYSCTASSPAGFINFTSSASCLPVLSPTSRNRDITTPPSRPGALVQSTMKDFLSTKKQRLLNTKTLPRT
ncbi:hypothetical protein BsWGS_27687 [Bradybaena similaris]